MPKSPAPSLSERQVAELRYEKLMQAYRRVFGVDSAGRTEDQLLIWEDLQKVGYMRSSLFQPDAAGAVCPLRAALAEGRRTVFLYIEANVKSVPSVQQ